MPLHYKQCSFPFFCIKCKCFKTVFCQFTFLCFFFSHRLKFLTKFFLFNRRREEETEVVGKKKNLIHQQEKKLLRLRTSSKLFCCKRRKTKTAKKRGLTKSKKKNDAVLFNCRSNGSIIGFGQLCKYSNKSSDTSSSFKS